MAKVYIAGPMRGLPASNFPAFDRATRLGRAHGWDVVNPADMDRAEGVSGDNPGPIGPRECRVFASRDINAILSFRAEDGDAIALLPGWERSTGAKAELAMAKWVGLRVLSALNFRDTEAMIQGVQSAYAVPAEFQNGGCGPSGCLTTGSDGLQESVTLADQQRVREYLEFGSCESGVCGLSKDLETSALMIVAQRIADDPNL